MRAVPMKPPSGYVGARGEVRGAALEVLDEPAAHGLAEGHEEARRGLDPEEVLKGVHGSAREVEEHVDDASGGVPETAHEAGDYVDARMDEHAAETADRADEGGADPGERVDKAGENFGDSRDGRPEKVDRRSCSARARPPT